MYVDFDSMQETSRIWVYQSSRELTETEQEHVREVLKGFVEEWTRHGDSLKASYTIRYGHFIILAVDESFNQVSGCSIDASTHVFKGLEKQFGIDLLNKLNTAFRIGEHINIVSLQDFKKYVAENKIAEDTIVFNNLVQTKGELDRDWEVPAHHSWHKRYFN